MHFLNSPLSATPIPPLPYTQSSFYIPVPRGNEEVPGFPLAVIEAREFYDTEGCKLHVLNPVEFRRRYAIVLRVVTAWENAEVHRNSNPPVPTAYVPGGDGILVERVSIQRILFAPCEGPARMLQEDEYSQLIANLRNQSSKRSRD